MADDYSWGCRHRLFLNDRGTVLALDSNKEHGKLSRSDIEHEMQEVNFPQKRWQEEYLSFNNLPDEFKEYWAYLNEDWRDAWMDFQTTNSRSFLESERYVLTILWTNLHKKHKIKYFKRPVRAGCSYNFSPCQCNAYCV